MNWIKRKFIFKPNGEFDWLSEYAQVPTPIELEDRIRIFFTTRSFPVNQLYTSKIAYIDVDKNKPDKIINISQKPVLDLGSIGTFDEFGSMPGSVIKIKDKFYLYYTGWSREIGVPYSTSIGIAVCEDLNLRFKKMFIGPILSKNIFDPYLVNGPFVYFYKKQYYMFYSSAYSWINNNSQKDPIYKIKYALSEDGINWKINDSFIIEEIFSDEAQNAPSIFEYCNNHYMIFCYRRSENFRNGYNGYRLGIAVSKDLLNWERLEDPILKGEKEEWDNSMQAYPRVLNINNKLLLFYNGNYFGKEGFGYAELEL